MSAPTAYPGPLRRPRLFRKVSRLLDPRIGRGMFNTFHVSHPFFPMAGGSVFHSKHFTLVRLARLSSCGSDRFPVLVEPALEDEAPKMQEA